MRLEFYKALIHGLPPQNYELCKFLLTFLKEVSSHNEINKMSTSNLAIIFGPSLFGTIELDFAGSSVQLDPIALFKESKLVTDITSQLIEHANDIFTVCFSSLDLFSFLSFCFSPSCCLCDGKTGGKKCGNLGLHCHRNDDGSWRGKAHDLERRHHRRHLFVAEIMSRPHWGDHVSDPYPHSHQDEAHTFHRHQRP